LPPENQKGHERRAHPDHEAYFNAQFDAEPLIVQPGDAVTTGGAGDMLVATLGSGVAMAIYDPDLKLGSLAYVLAGRDAINAFPNFEKGDTSIPEKACEPLQRCIMEMKQKGAGKGRIRIRLFGGTSLPGDKDDMGTKNYIFVKEYLLRKGLAVVREDLLGTYICRLHFFPTTGRAVRRMLRRDSDFEEMRKMEAGFMA